MDRYPARTHCFSPLAGPSARRSAADPPVFLALLANRCPDRSRRHCDQHLLRGGSAVHGPELHAVPPGDHRILLGSEAKQAYLGVKLWYSLATVRHTCRTISNGAPTA